LVLQIAIDLQMEAIDQNRHLDGMVGYRI